MAASPRLLDPGSPPGTLSFCEFFAGGGMARAGLGSGWKCVYANDFDLKKALTYEANWGPGVLKTGDIGKVKAVDLPANPALMWASFPCQDLSLAGMGAGLKGDRSGTFWPFWKLVKDLNSKGHGPQTVVLENVCGTLTSHEGKDFTAIASALADAGFTYGAVVVDAALFVPHSRPRLFVIGVAQRSAIRPELISDRPSDLWHTKALRKAHDSLPNSVVKNWVWWNLPAPSKRGKSLIDLLEENPADVQWHTGEETDRLLKMMSPLNLKKVKEAQASRRVTVGAVYKRTRFNRVGRKVQRAEVRFDGLAGCLRTSSGGSSRQLILVIHGNLVRSRLLSGRETARLMGLPDSYELPHNYNEAYHLTGDGVVVPVVRHLAKHILEQVVKPDPAHSQMVA